MEGLLKVVQELEKIRNLPQFIFIAPIRGFSTITVRETIHKFIKDNPDKKEIDFILESPGGSADEAYKIIRTLRENFETVNIIVPFWAKSAATLLALGGSTIIMDEFGEFGPLDVQLFKDDELPQSAPQSGLIDEYSLATIEKRATLLYQGMLRKLLKRNEDEDEIDIRLKKTILSKQLLEYIPNLYKPLYERIDPYQIGEKARSLAIAENYADRILRKYNEENMIEDVNRFVDYMVHECPDHGYIVDYSIMSLFLKNVKKSSDISEDYYNSLTKLSIMLFKNPGNYSYIGFFNAKLLEKKVKKDDTKKEALVESENKKEGENDEDRKTKK